MANQKKQTSEAAVRETRRRSTKLKAETRTSTPRTE